MRADETIQLVEEVRNLVLQQGEFLTQHRNHDQDHRQDREHQQQYHDQHRQRARKRIFADTPARQPVNPRIKCIGEDGGGDERRQDRPQRDH